MRISAILNTHLKKFCSNSIRYRFSYGSIVCENFVSKTRYPLCFQTFSNITLKMQCCGPTGCGVNFSKDDLKQRLTAQQFQVTQEKDTERAFTGKYNNHFEKGVYNCIVCNQDLFPSEAKFESRCGWPAFFDVVDGSKVKLKDDLSHDMKRTEVSCSQCDAHLGHVFDDGPKPTLKRYCINSAALNFTKSEDCSAKDSES